MLRDNYTKKLLHASTHFNGGTDELDVNDLADTDTFLHHQNTDTDLDPVYEATFLKKADLTLDAQMRALLISG